MSKVLCKLFVSMAGFLNGVHSKAQLPDVTFYYSSPFQIPKSQKNEVEYICVYKMHVVYSLHAPASASLLS